MKFNLRTQIATWLLLLTLIPLCWTFIFTYKLSSDNFLKQTKRDTESSVIKQANLLDHYINVRITQGNKIVDSMTTPPQLEVVRAILGDSNVEEAESETAREIFHQFMARELKSLNYSYLFLLTSEGKIKDGILANGQRDAEPFLRTLDNYIKNMDAYEFGKNFKKAKEAKRITINAIYINEFPSSYFAFTTLPITTEDKIIGYAFAVFDALPFYQVLGEDNEFVIDHERPKNTVVAITIVGNDFYLTKPENVMEQPTPQTLLINEPPFKKFIENVLQEQGVHIDIMNFQNKKTLVISRHFNSSLNWVIANIVPMEQILAPIQNLKKLFWILFGVTSSFVIILAAYLARRISQPILTLTDKTKRLASGDLSQRIEVLRRDEIGELGTSFNYMANELNHLISHLDSLVDKRTKQYEEKNAELEKAIKKLEQIQDRLIYQEKLASLGQLTAGIAHEIKNPLNFINNFAELTSQIQQDLEEETTKIQNSIPKEEQERIVELLETLKVDIGKIYEHGKRADGIVKNMLQHSRAIPGQIEQVNLNPLIEEYISLAYHGMRTQYQSFNIKIEKNLDPMLPMVSIVPQEISRVIINLINNAIYALHEKVLSSPPAYVPTLVITTAQKEGHVVIKIWDNGVGISKEVQSHLFTPFYTTKPSGEGTGLGLSLSYNIIVQGHHGTLTVNSEAGEFAEFIISLPLE